MKIDKLVVDGEDITEKIVSVFADLSGNVLVVKLSNFASEVQKSAEKSFNSALGVKNELW